MAEFRFTINGRYTLETFPMQRLAEYMAEISVLLGEPDNVHFLRVEDGSIDILSNVAERYAPRAVDRVQSARRGTGPREPINAIRSINKMLAQDKGTASFTAAPLPMAIEFVGDTAPSVKAFTQQGNLDGAVIAVGGKNDPVPVHLESTDPSKVTYNCLAKRDLAKELGQYLFGREIRAYGAGRWFRDEFGVWQLERFLISNFEVLDNLSLSGAVARLRSIQGSGWSELDEPWKELDRIRRDDSDEGGD